MDKLDRYIDHKFCKMLPLNPSPKPPQQQLTCKQPASTQKPTTRSTCSSAPNEPHTMHVSAQQNEYFLFQFLLKKQLSIKSKNLSLILHGEWSYKVLKNHICLDGVDMRNVWEFQIYRSS